MIIRIDKALLESMHLFRALPKNEWRQQLTGIMFDKDGTVWASNGHVCLVARTGKAIEESMVLNIEKTAAAAKKYQFAIIDTQQAIISYIPPFEGCESASDEDCIAVRLGVGKVAEMPGGMKLANPIPPEVKPVSSIVFDADYLAILPKVADLFGKQDSGKFAFSLTGNNTAALTKIKAGQPYQLTVILMPIIV